MVSVIGTSTVEYGLKGLYEHTVGRLAEALTPNVTPRGRTASVPGSRRSTSTLFALIRDLFVFGARLKALWSDLPAGGPGLLRRWECRYGLTTEYAVKEVYARLIKWATRSIYDAPKAATAVSLDRWTVRRAQTSYEARTCRCSARRPAMRALRRYPVMKASPPMHA